MINAPADVCMTTLKDFRQNGNLSSFPLPQYIRSWCNESLINRYDSRLTVDEMNILWSSVVSVFLIGGVVGSLGAAWINDHLGR